MPAAEASQCVEATMPNVPASSGLVVNCGIPATGNSDSRCDHLSTGCAYAAHALGRRIFAIRPARPGAIGTTPQTIRHAPGKRHDFIGFTGPASARWLAPGGDGRARGRVRLVRDELVVDRDGHRDTVVERCSGDVTGADGFELAGTGRARAVRH